MVAGAAVVLSGSHCFGKLVGSGEDGGCIDGLVRRVGDEIDV